jgi:hypothetical protein
LLRSVPAATPEAERFNGEPLDLLARQKNSDLPWIPIEAKEECAVSCQSLMHVQRISVRHQEM